MSMLSQNAKRSATSSGVAPYKKWNPPEFHDTDKLDATSRRDTAPSVTSLTASPLTKTLNYSPQEEFGEEACFLENQNYDRTVSSQSYSDRRKYLGYEYDSPRRKYRDERLFFPNQHGEFPERQCWPQLIMPQKFPYAAVPQVQLLPTQVVSPAYACSSPVTPQQHLIPPPFMSYEHHIDNSPVFSQLTCCPHTSPQSYHYERSIFPSPDPYEEEYSQTIYDLNPTQTCYSQAKEDEKSLLQSPFPEHIKRQDDQFRLKAPPPPAYQNDLLPTPSRVDKRRKLPKIKEKSPQVEEKSVSDSDTPESRPMVDGKPLKSIGSKLHFENLNCKPCGFYHKKTGCTNNYKCKFCHECGPDELKNRKRGKNLIMKLIKMNRNLANEENSRDHFLGFRNS